MCIHDHFYDYSHDSPGTLFHLTMNYVSDWVSHNWHHKMFYDEVGEDFSALGRALSGMGTLEHR